MFIAQRVALWLIRSPPLLRSHRYKCLMPSSSSSKQFPLICAKATEYSQQKLAQQFTNEDQHREKQQNSHSHQNPLMAWTLFGILGFEEWQKLDDDPLKDKVKRAMLLRKYARYKEAIEVLDEALADAEKLGNPKIVTRILDELANAYYEADELQNAEKLFRLVIHRLITLHRKTESSPEFIGISLKLADIFARKGDPESADIGYRHCLSKQLQEVDKTLSNYHLEHGANVETPMPVDRIGLDYTESFALLGMCLHEYSLFLLDFYADTRLDEAQEYILEALKVSQKIYGLNTFHSMNLLSTFAAKCVIKNKFEMARKFLELGLDRLLLLPECESIVLSYYCCYAEALFHTGEQEKAVEYAKRAAELAKSHENPAPRAYIKKFAKQMQRDASRRGGGGGRSEGANWFWPF